MLDPKKNFLYSKVMANKDRAPINNLIGDGTKKMAVKKKMNFTINKSIHKYIIYPIKIVLLSGILS